MKKVLTILGFIFLVINIFSVQLSDGLNDLHNPQFREDPPPSPTTPQIPAITAQEVTEYPVFSWNEATGELTSYKFYLGTDGSGETSPTNLVAGLDVGNNLSYYPDIELTLDQTYYWQVVPTHSENGDAIDCPIWSFKTKTEASEAVPYRQFFESSNNFTGDLTTTTNGGTQSTGGLISSALYGNMVSSNSFGPITDESQLVFYYRLTNYQLLGAVSPNEDLLTTFISYDNINYEAIHHLSMYEPSLNDQYKKITIDLDNYQGAYYIKIYYNIYSFSDSFLGIGPNIYFDNFFVREANLQTNLDVSPSTWNAGTVLINESTSQEVTITNFGTSEVNIQNLSLNFDITALHFFSLSNTPSTFSLPEGYHQIFTVTYAPIVDGNHNSNIVYNFPNTPDSGIATPQTLMSVYGSCIGPTITNFPYIQDFEEWPLFGWSSTIEENYADSEENHWIKLDNTLLNIVTTPKIILREHNIVQFTWYREHLNISITNATFTLQIATVNNNVVSDWNEIMVICDNNEGTDFYENGILINSVIKEAITLPPEYQYQTILLKFEVINLINPHPFMIDDLKILSNYITSVSLVTHPEVEIREQSGFPVLHWDHVDFADSYQIEAKNEPYSDNWIPLATTPFQGYVYTGDEKYKFFRVKSIMNDE